MAIKKQVWIYILLLAAIFTSFKMYKNPGVDFRLYYSTIQKAHEGTPEKGYLGSGGEFTYMPFANLLLQPFGLLSLKAANFVFYLLSIVFLFLTCFVLIEILSREGKYRGFVVGFALLMTGRFLQISFFYGQANVLILFACVMGMYFAYLNKNFSSAAFWAVAISFKVTPIIFIGYYLLKKKYKLVLWIMGLLLVTNFILPVLFFGVEKGLLVYGAWFRSLFALAGDHAARYDNLSFLGLLYRYLSDLSWPIVQVPFGKINFVSLSLFQLKVIYFITAVLILVLMISVLFRRKRQARGETNKISFGEYGLIFLFMLIFSPISWQHHYVLLFVPYFAIWAHLSEVGIKKNPLVLILVLLSFGLNTLTVSGIVGQSLCAMFMHYSTITIGSMLLMIALGLSIVKGK